ncbi:MAG: glucose-6-phosphate dehydrogenase assembly protein OpcA [Ktedonobacterales bacterium]
MDGSWREVNAYLSSTAGHGIARNSVLTLAVITQSITEAQLILDAVHTLNSQHPSRAIIVSADPNQPGQEMRAHVATYVGKSAASYGEDIVIEVQRDAVRHLPGVVLPLIVSGLPSVLWWTGEPPWGTELLEALIDGSDRFVVDTSEVTHVEKTFISLADIMRRKLARCAVSDISWTSQSPWRDMLAQFFDPPEMRPYLDGIERVTIEYAAGEEDAPTNSAQAYLFSGWLASRLDWHVSGAQPGGVDGNRQHTLRDDDGHVINLEINARYNVPQRHWWNREPQATPGGNGAHASSASSPWVRVGALMSVHITSRVNGQRGTFAVARERDLAHATTLCQAPNCNIPSQTVHLQSIGERELLDDQLRYLGHEPVYEEALNATALLIGGAGRRNVL